MSDWPVLTATLKRWRDRTALTSSEFAALEDEFKAQATRLAGVWDRRFVEEIQASLAEAMSSGSTVKDWLKSAQKLLDGYGGDVTVFSGQEFSAWYADVVFRTNTQASMAAGRYAQMFRPSRIRAIPYVLYSAIADARTRPTHLALNGKLFRKDDPDARRYFPPSGFNCFPAETLVRGSFDGALKARYTGEVVKVTTRRGNRLTVTGKHPVATPRGLVPADQLKQGEHLLCYSGRVEDGIDPDRADEAVRGVFASNKPALAPRYTHEQYGPSSIEKVFETLALMSDLLHAPCGADDLYGEGRHLDGDVDVVALGRELREDGRTPRAESVNEFSLSGVNETESLPSGLRALLDLGAGMLAASRSIPRGAALPSDGGRVGLHARPLQQLRIASSSDRRASTNEAPANRASADPKAISEGLLGLPGFVTADEISVVEVNTVSALPVFDLQSRHGWILAGNIYTSNCRCQLIELDQVEADEGGYQVTPGRSISSLLPGIDLQPEEGWNSDRVSSLVPDVLRRAA